MKWVAKAFLQKAFSLLPYGESVNYMFQRYITKSLPSDPHTFLNYIDFAFKHFRQITANRDIGTIKELKLYEFGAGWDFVIPLTYAAIGFQNQTIIDIVPHLRVFLVEETLNFLKTNRSLIEERHNYKLHDNFFAKLSNNMINMKFLQSIGINYIAPLDARNTQFKTNSYDVITSTCTLEHIPGTYISEIFRECFRILKPGGVMSSIIDMKDHFAGIDDSISPYNFLKFSDKVWNFLYNSSLHYQNRLRVYDYLDMFNNTGFNILFQKKYYEKHEIDELKLIKLNKLFSIAKLEDVATNRLDILVQKPLTTTK